MVVRPGKTVVVTPFQPSFLRETSPTPHSVCLLDPLPLTALPEMTTRLPGSSVPFVPPPRGVGTVSVSFTSACARSPRCSAGTGTWTEEARLAVRKWGQDLRAPGAPGR